MNLFWAEGLPPLGLPALVSEPAEVPASVVNRRFWRSGDAGECAKSAILAVGGAGECGKSCLGHVFHLHFRVEGTAVGSNRVPMSVKQS